MSLDRRCEALKHWSYFHNCAVDHWVALIFNSLDLLQLQAA